MAKPLPGPDWAVSPQGWGARINYDAWRDEYTPDDSIGLHHGGGGNYVAHQPPYSFAKETAQLRNWEYYHVVRKGWRGLAYGWALGMTGNVYRIRGWNTYGAHSGDRDADHISNNKEVIPILVIGSGNYVSLSRAAEETFGYLRHYLEEESGRALRLYGHQELKGIVTTCPGPKLMEYVKAHRNLEGDEVVTRNSKADEGQSALAGNFEKAVAKGVFSAATQPGGVTFNDELATFLQRAGVFEIDNLAQRIAELEAAQGNGNCENCIKEGEAVKIVKE